MPAVKGYWFPSSYQVMVKPRGPICNLACAYCYFLSKERLYPGSDFRMSDGLLEEFTRQYLQNQPTHQVTFAWQGGEPTLMGLEFYYKVVEYQKKYAPAGLMVENALQTNATQLDDDWCQFFKENNFLIGVSIDGPPAVHDHYRQDKGGNGSAERVLAGLTLLKKHSVEHNILCTVHAGNVQHPLKVYRYLRDELSAEFIQFIPIVERDNKTGFQTGNKVTERSVTGEQYGNFLTKVFDEWLQHDVGTVFVQLFDVALAKWVGAPGGLCVFEETCGLALALEHNGDLYSCDHFVEPKYKLGNIVRTEMIDLVRSHQQYQFGVDKRDKLPRYCLACEVRFACNGGCPKNRFKHSPDGEFGLNYLCAGYREFFNHIDRPMRLMAELLRQRRPPADIMCLSE